MHLLGGSPQRQHQLVKEFNTVSIDGNYFQKMATRYCQFWSPVGLDSAVNLHWPTLFEADGKRWEGDAPYEAFERSCKNIMEYWHNGQIPSP